jgi:hypothetical protein
MFQRIRQSVKPMSQPALTKVEIVHTTSLLDPTTGEAIVSNIVQVVDTRAELKAAIIARNKRHFSQASNTPFAQPPLHCIGSDNAFNIYKRAAGGKIFLPPTPSPRPSWSWTSFRNEPNNASRAGRQSLISKKTSSQRFFTGGNAPLPPRAVDILGCTKPWRPHIAIRATNFPSFVTTTTPPWAQFKNRQNRSYASSMASPLKPPSSASTCADGFKL